MIRVVGMVRLMKDKGCLFILYYLMLGFGSVRVVYSVIVKFVDFNFDNRMKVLRRFFRIKEEMR